MPNIQIIPGEKISQTAIFRYSKRDVRCPAPLRKTNSANATLHLNGAKRSVDLSARNEEGKNIATIG